MNRSIELKETFKVKPSVIYNAWLNSQEHTKMTVGEAICSDRIGGDFTAWDGYISGNNVSFTINKEIIQNWRTADFVDNDEDSILIIRLVEIKDGCELTLIHDIIPLEDSDYEEGWKVHYLTPMKMYFNK